MDELRNRVISKLENREPPFACLLLIENHGFDDVAGMLKEICKEKELDFVLLPPMFPLEKSKLRNEIEKYVDVPRKTVMLSKTDKLPHYETIVSTLEQNMYLFIVYTKGKSERGVWEVVR